MDAKFTDLLQGTRCASSSTFSVSSSLQPSECDKIATASKTERISENKRRTENVENSNKYASNQKRAQVIKEYHNS